MKNSEEELKYYRDISIFVIEFMTTSQGEHPTADWWINTINSYYEGGDLKGLKECWDELCGWIRSLPNSFSKLLEQELIKKFGMSFKKLNYGILKIIENGIIKNDKEFEILYNFSNDLSQDSPLYDKIEKIEEMLYNYNK